MSAIRALGNGATAATPYPGTQAGYDAAIAALTSAGGVIELSGGLEAVNLGSIPANIVVLRFRTSSTVGLEIGASADLILANTRSVRITDSGGILRTVLTGLGTDVLRLAYLGSGGLTITDQNGNVKATITGSRVNLASGVDLAFNGSAGTAGVSVPISGGAAASPTWGTPAGLPGSAMIVPLPAHLWLNGDLTVTASSAVRYIYHTQSGAADSSDYLCFTYPSSYTGTTSWKMHWTATGDFGVNCQFTLSMFKYTAGLLLTTATYVDGATLTVAAPAAANTLSIDTLPTPALTVAAGDTVILKLTRLGADLNTFASNFIGMYLNYT